MNPVLRRSTAHLVVDSLDAPTVDADDEHHLVRVLRVRPTDVITVTDGAGSWREARWGDGGLVCVGATQRGPAPRSETDWRTVGCAIPKGDRPEWIVQKLTELGLDRILLFEATRSVVRWDARKRVAQLDRLRKVAREAAMQSRRLTLPVVDVVNWDDALELPGVAVAEPGGRSNWWEVEPNRIALGVVPSVRSVLVGPEGGFTDDELAACPDRVALGQAVLRVETAAITAGVLMTAAMDGRFS